METRQENAIKIISKINGITKISKELFLVKSQYHEKMAYLVRRISRNAWTCQCDDFMYRLTRKDEKHCKHIISCIILRNAL